MQSAPCQLAKKAFHKSTPPDTTQDARLFRMHPATSGGALANTQLLCPAPALVAHQGAKCESTFAPTPSPMGAVVRRTCLPCPPGQGGWKALCNHSVLVSRTVDTSWFLPSFFRRGFIVFLLVRPGPPKQAPPTPQRK